MQLFKTKIKVHLKKLCNFFLTQFYEKFNQTLNLRQELSYISLVFGKIQLLNFCRKKTLYALK